MIMCVILSLPGSIGLNKIDEVCMHLYFTIQSYNVVVAKILPADAEAEYGNGQ